MATHRPLRRAVIAGAAAGSGVDRTVSMVALDLQRRHQPGCHIQCDQHDDWRNRNGSRFFMVLHAGTAAASAPEGDTTITRSARWSERDGSFLANFSYGNRWERQYHRNSGAASLLWNCRCRRHDEHRRSRRQTSLARTSSGEPSP